MSSKETFFSFFSQNKALVKEYIDTRLELIKLQGVRTLSRTISAIMIIFIISLLCLSILLLIGITFAFWIADITGSNIAGFASSAGLFILFLIGFIVFGRRMVQNQIIKRIIQDSMDDSEDID
jgi:Putative Actinobacterial Holin-X, holin superfamily III